MQSCILLVILNSANPENNDHTKNTAVLFDTFHHKTD